jgi:hypothetical protein
LIGTCHIHFLIINSSKGLPNKTLFDYNCTVHGTVMSNEKRGLKLINGQPRRIPEKLLIEFGIDISISKRD